VSRSRFRRGPYEDLFEVCCQFLDERVSGDRIDGYGPDHVNRKDKEEERELYDEHCASGDYEYERLRTDAEWDYGGGHDGFSSNNFSDSDDCDHA
jgi:hypothetical protein